MSVTTSERTPDEGVVAPAVPDPGATARLPRPHRPLWPRLLVVLGSVLILVSALGLAGSRWLVSSATGAIVRENLLGDTLKSAAEGGASLDGPIDLLLLGVDARARLGAENTRSDTIIVLHIPSTHDQAYLISIPRDTEVRAPAFPRSGYAGGTEKLTDVFYRGVQNGAGWAGGAQLVAGTIKQLTGISFDGAAIIDFNGFKGVIEALGGVHMCVDQQVKSAHMYVVGGKVMYKAEARKLGDLRTPVLHKKGCRDMAGWEALDFARQRYDLTNGDYDRQRHQQQLIKAMAKKASSGGAITDLSQVSRLITAAGKAFILDTGTTPVADFLFSMKGIATNDLVLLRTNDGRFAMNRAGRETLTEQSKQMFAAVKDDRLGAFIVSNPSVVAREK